MNRVSLAQLNDYQPQAVRQALAELLVPLGGMAAFVRPGQKVLIKPNMLAGKPPDRAVTTHPEIVRAVIEQVQAVGGIVSVGDSPGLGHPEQVARKCGILPVIEATGARFAPFDESTGVDAGNGTFHRLELARDILEADVIINLPKLKTHQMMGLTCAVKNLYGGVVGMRKAQLHLQAGEDKTFFALMLLELAETIAPALTIVDGVVGMEGKGPGSGDPVTIGALLAGTNPVAIDTLAARLVGLTPEQVWTWKVAQQTGRPGCEPEQVAPVGAPMANFALRPIRPAPPTEADFGLPAFVQRRLKRTLSAYPQIDHDICIRCGHCVTHCPPQAMSLDDRVHIDELRCIRCFCCQELCPHKAIDTRQGWMLRLLRRGR